MANELFHFNGVQAILTDIGLSLEEANTIASASQAVDDFHEDKLVCFENGELFYPVVTAHRMLDPDNLDSRDASNIWMPFHFFPNHKGVCEPDTDNVDKLIQFVKDYPLRNTHEKHLLHGILLHIYVDTYTHQGFMGLFCKHNDISDLDDKDTWDVAWLKGNLPPSIGHGEALTYLDDMWRRWCYTDANNKTVNRDNQKLFLKITRNIQKLMCELGYEVNALSRAQERNYKRIYAIKGDEKEYEGRIKREFDAITKDNVGERENISYQKWKKDVMRKVQSKENKYIRDNSIPYPFDDSKWVTFQKLSKDIRTFFKKEIFPNMRIDTTVY